MDLDRFITETVRKHLLVEGAINNSWHQARKMVIAKFGYTKEEAEKMLDEICNQLSISHEMVKFIKGCTRMVLNGELNDQRVLGDFKDTLNKIKTDGHIGEFDTNLRRLDQPENAVNSAKDIIAIFKPKIDSERAEQRQKLSGMEFEPKKDYEIVKINSFEEARKYSRYTSWCVTSRKVNYDGYTTNGINQFYFCLQNGFENIENDGNFEDKKDAYALSMLAILVNPEGDLIHCTNRKNNDQSTLNPFEISELVGRNFYETFKPNTTWRDALEDVKKQLANGESPDDVFDEVVELNNGLFLVRLLKRWNLLKGSSFMNEYWYDGVGNFHEGFAPVKDVNKGWNFINRDGKEICDRWYDNINDFHEGFAMVCEKGKGWIFINRDGEEISDRWYDNVNDFHEGLAWVGDKNKGWNFINRDGKEICNRWYHSVRKFSKGFASVQDATKGWNFINREGNEIGDRWYDDVYDFCEGFAKVVDFNKGCNFINREGNELCDRWYDCVWDFCEGFAKVVDFNKGCNFINSEGNELCDRWYNNALDFSEGFARVWDEGKGCNFINREGKEICDRWYGYLSDFKEGLARVNDKTKGRNFINREGKEICDRWYDEVHDFSEGFAKVEDDNKGFNFINRDGKEIGDRWYKSAWSFFKGFAVVVYKGNDYQLRKDGVLCDYKTRKPLEDTPAQMVESIINRLVRDVLSENRKRYYL